MGFNSCTEWRPLITVIDNSLTLLGGESTKVESSIGTLKQFWEFNIKETVLQEVGKSCVPLFNSKTG